MSLDVCLNGETKTVKCFCSTCDLEHERQERQNFYWANITHNLTAMAEEAGIYKHLWCPEEIGITKAKELIKPLRKGLALMKEDPARFKKHNPANGWGSYKGFVPWIEKYLSACEENPEAEISVSK